MTRPLHGILGKAYEQCRPEGAQYAKCIEKKLEGGGFAQGVCEQEFRVLKECVRAKYHPVERSGGNPFQRR